VTTINHQGDNVAKPTGTPQEPLHQEDVVEILLRQHARIQEGFIQVKAATGTERQARFNELRALLAAHETAEEMVLRPVTVQTAGSAVADARNAEEKEANQVLSRLDGLDVTSDDFDSLFREFQQMVLDHAAKEESEEFPHVQKGRTPEQLASMGQVLLAVEKIAPTHPHPSTAGSPTLQWALGPFVSVLDRARDALADQVKHR
jgi:hemerythrin superfamily protein